MTDALPAPLVPHDVDITGLDGFMLDVQRLFSSELWALSTGDEFKAALALWGRAWQQSHPGSLPDDERILAAFSGNATKWRKLREMAMRGFVKCSDGRWYHKTLCEQVLEVAPRAATIRRRVDRRLQVASEEWASLRIAVFSRDDFTCRYCSARGVKLECDHVIPVSRGGDTALSNLVTSCTACNRSKGVKLLAEWKR